MLIDNYNVPVENKNVIRIGSTPDVLKEASIDPASAPSLVVWRGALVDPLIDEGMKKSDWIIRVLSSLADTPTWRWETQHSAHNDTLTDRAEILRLTRLASGIDDKPQGNLVTTLNIRTYQNAASDIGGFTWWQEHNQNSGIQDQFVKTVFGGIETMLGRVRKAGADFYVEQVALITAKDSNSPAATLTPTLHSNEFYGFRETALVSLLEYGHNPFGGTVFVPTMKMKQLEQHRPISIHKLIELVPDAPIVKSNSGDIAYYDGMIGQDGVASMANGIPHISPDLPGVSSRAVILMRNKRVPTLG